MSSEQLAAQRLAEAPAIEAEWAAMSYKDRASWWMSAKWYGYMSTEAYRRGDATANANESCRYGEPGFFIATRVPYYETQVAVSIVAPTQTSPVAQEIAPVAQSTAVVEAITIPSKPTTESEESNPAPAASEIIVPTTTPSEESVEQPAAKSSTETMRNAIVGNIDSTNTPLLAAAIHSTASSTTSKKKKKNKHHAGKTIQIRVGSGTH